VKLGALHPLKADYSLINQVMINFISNAVKYSSKRAKPLVEIGSAINKDGEVVYSVIDNGVGFNMDYAHKMFGVFQRLHTLEEFEGTGVGLAIVQRVINKHGGKVWAESKIGEGAAFHFSIPNQ
jgi:light-regulated signal transduction histidine kinase (bacteriophytochrome)